MKRMKVINLKEESSKIDKLYEYKIIAKMNNHKFTLVKAKVINTIYA